MRWDFVLLVVCVVLAGGSGWLLHTSREAPRLWTSVAELERVGEPREGEMHPPVLSPSAAAIVHRRCDQPIRDRGVNCYSAAQKEIGALARELEQRSVPGMVGLVLAAVLALGALSLSWMQHRADRRIRRAIDASPPSG